LSNSSGRAKSKSCHNIKKQNKWETKGFINVTNCKKELKKDSKIQPRSAYTRSWQGITVITYLPASSSKIADVVS